MSLVVNETLSDGQKLGHISIVCTIVIATIGGLSTLVYGLSKLSSKKETMVQVQGHVLESRIEHSSANSSTTVLTVGYYADKKHRKTTIRLTESDQTFKAGDDIKLEYSDPDKPHICCEATSLTLVSIGAGCLVFAFFLYLLRNNRFVETMAVFNFFSRSN